LSHSSEIHRRCAALHLLFAHGGGANNTQALDQVYLLCRSLRQIVNDERSLAHLRSVEDNAARFFCGPAPEPLRPHIVRALVLLDNGRGA
jgi:hypothetical protein